MTNEQKELLKAMHLIKEHCKKHNSCEDCFCAEHYFDDLGKCPFEEVPMENWELHDLETKEEINSVFK